MKNDSSMHRQLMTYPFMDIFFIMLIFMLVIGIVRYGEYCSTNAFPSGEVGVGIAENKYDIVFSPPVEGLGEANLFVQLNANQSYYWIEFAECMEKLSDTNVNKDSVIQTMRYPMDSLSMKWAVYADNLKNQGIRTANIAMRGIGSMSASQILSCCDVLKRAASADNVVITPRFALLPSVMDDSDIEIEYTVDGEIILPLR